MELKEIKETCPDIFSYNGEEFTMIHYGMAATHKGQRSDEIVWESENKKTNIYYNKGLIYVVDEATGNILAELN